MGTKTGLNGITFGDATVQNTAAVTGVSSAVAGSGISVSGATGAVTFTNSGVTSIVAGSGISISGGTGAVTVTNSAQGTTYSAGNGLSLSSTTFSVAAPSYGSVGSYANALPPDSTVDVRGGTTAGSTLAAFYGGNCSYYNLGLSGTWKLMGANYISNASSFVNSRNSGCATLLVRVS